METGGDNRDGTPSTAVGGLPLTARDPSLDVAKVTFSAVAASGVGELAPEDYVVDRGVILVLWWRPGWS